MKKLLSIIIGLMLIPFLGFAANDVSLVETSAQISVGGYTLAVTGGSRTIDSMTVNSDDFTVTLSPGANFGVSSADKKKLTVSPATYVRLTSTCSSSESTVSMTTTQNSGSITVTISPSSSNCVVGEGGGGSSSSGSGSTGGGGGGGGSVVAVTAPQTTVVAPAATPKTVSSSAASVSSVFSRDINKGVTSNEVKRLQQLLATDKEIYPDGIISGYYGKLTEKAVLRFQLKYGVIQKETEVGSGRVGPKTRAKLEEVFGGAATNVSGGTSVITPSMTEGEKISALQSQLQQLQAQLLILLEQAKKTSGQ